MKNSFGYTKKSSLEIVFSAIFNLLLTLIIIAGILISAFYLTHNTTPYAINGHSMEPGIQNEGQCCFVTNLNNYTYGDIVIATSPEDVKIIKRVIGMPGDKLGYYKDTDNFYKILLISGDKEIILDEPYLTANITDETEKAEYLSHNATSKYYFENKTNASRLSNYVYNNQTVKIITLADDEVFLLGDNRLKSKDCSNYGPIKTDKITARVDLVVNTNSMYLVEILKYMIGI